MSCSLRNIRLYPEIYYYYDNKNCYPYHDKILISASILSYYLDYCTALVDILILYRYHSNSSDTENTYIFLDLFDI